MSEGHVWSNERFGFWLTIFGFLSLIAAAISYIVGGPWILAAGYWLGSGVTELIIGPLIRTYYRRQRTQPSSSTQNEFS